MGQPLPVILVVSGAPWLIDGHLIPVPLGCLLSVPVSLCVQVPPILFLFYLIFSYLLLSSPRDIFSSHREEGEERGRERNIDWLPSRMQPDWGLNPQPGHVP